jgi:hypothetical protein
MIGRPPRRFRRNTGKAHRRQVQFVDENINDADRALVRHIIFQTVREQCRLPPILALNETLHSATLSGIILTDQCVSTQAAPKAAVGNVPTTIGATVVSHAPLRRVPDGGGRDFSNPVRRHLADDCAAAADALGVHGMESSRVRLDICDNSSDKVTL